MKYEISDVINDKYIYGLTILRIHKKVNKSVIFRMVLKIPICNYFIYFLLALIFNSMGLIILSCDFNNDYSNNSIYLSKYIRIITPLYFIEKININNLSYLIICLIFMVICIIRSIYLQNLYRKTKSFHISEVYKINVNFIFIILNHLIYMFSSYIIEFLSFIYYIELFPNKFLIKKDKSLNLVVNRIFLGLNFVFIIIYNFYNYLFFELINTPNGDKIYPLQMKMPNIKFYLLVLLQNTSILQPLCLLLSEQQLKLYNIIISIIIIILIILMYIICLKAFNYDNIINNILSFFGEFCLVSLILEIILYISSIKYATIKSLILFTIIKIIITICLFFTLERIYERIMLREIRKELFLKDSNNYSYDKSIVSYILYLKEIIINNSRILVNIIKYLNDHQEYCLNKYCGCKIIKLSSKTDSDLNNSLKDLKQQINHFIETILIKFDFNYDFEYAYLLSEHFFLVKKNPIMAYSVLQTLLHNNYKNLTVRQLIFIYGKLNSYINYSLKVKLKKRNIQKFNYNLKILTEENKEYELKQYFNLLLTIKKITKLMKKYSFSFGEIVKYKQNYENSVVIDLDKSEGDIESINSSLLTHAFISEMIKLLESENKQTSDLKKLFLDLKEYSKILNYEFLFKSFLFIDYFWNATVPNEIKDILYGFTLNRSLYTNNLSCEIYDILEEKYNEKYMNYDTKYYLMLKYTKGIIISYASEALTRRLKYVKEDIVNHDMSALFINEFILPHNNAVNQYFMIKQNYILREKKVHIFNNLKYMVDCILDSTFQIGLNKNILIVCVVQLAEKSNDITFITNKNFQIISINDAFFNKFNLSLALIEEFKIEIKDLFDIYRNNIIKKYKKELDKLKEIKQYIQLDPKEYVLKNIFKQKKSKDNYRFMDDVISDKKDDENQDEDDENKPLKKKVSTKFINIVQKIYNNQNSDVLSAKSINFSINKDIVINKLRKMMETISLYEQGKLENKNIYQDFLRFNQNYNHVYPKNNIYINLNIKLKLMYDTPFYICQIEQYENNMILKDDFNFWDKKPNYSVDYDRDILSLIVKKSEIYLVNEKYKSPTNQDREVHKETLKDKVNKLKSEKEKIKTDKISKNLLGFILISLIFILLIIYIIILLYQMNLIKQADVIFKTLFYTYYQKAQLLYINSIILSFHYNLVNLTNTTEAKENRDILLTFGNNLEEGFHLFYKYYMDYKSGVGETVEDLYKKRKMNKITINWVNQEIYNDYIKEMQLVLFRAFDIANSKEFTQGDVEENEYFLLGKFLNNTNNKNIEVHGNLIRLLYYFLNNYDAVWDKFYNELTLSFEKSFNNFSEKTVTTFLLLEVLGILVYIIFFIINFIFLYKSNKYIFHNILCLFIDFTQKNKYSFNNRIDNLLINKIIINYISLLNEFTPKKLEILQTDIFNIDEILKNDKEMNRSLISDFKELENQNYIGTLRTDVSPEKRKKNSSPRNSDMKKARTKQAATALNLSSKNMEPKAKKTSDIISIHKLNFSNLSQNVLHDKNQNNEFSSKLINKSNVSIVTENNQNNSSIINLKDMNNDSLLNINKSKENNNNKSISKNEKSLNDANDNNNKLTIDKILLLSKIIIIQVIKIIMIIFIVFSVIFIVYYIVKIVLGFIIIMKIGKLYNDFKVLCSFYNEVIHYWNNMKTLFILPNTQVSTDLYNVEKYFAKKNTDVLNILNTRIKNYKRINILYDYLFNVDSKDDLLAADFCYGQEKCFEVLNSTQNILLNGLNSAISIYGKEIENFYRDYLKVKDEIKSKEDIKKYFIKDTFNILGININHIISHIEEKFFRDFLEDEEELKEGFYNEIKIFNLIALFYCIALNLFSLLFVFNYVNNIIAFVETSTMRIVEALCHLKNKIKDAINF